ncbi:uncharacterized protein ISCGN_000361 [Ixodes scapularis]
MKAARLIGGLAVLQLCCCGVTLGFVEYGNGATWERELPACASARSVCSLVHRRYWLSPLEIRLCRCPHKEPCPEGFETAPSAWAVNITSRTQLKMCSAWQPTNCTSDQTSLIMRTSRTFPSPERQGTKEIHADVLCQCAQDRDVYYRRTHGNNTADLTYYEQRQYFRCAPSARVDSRHSHSLKFQLLRHDHIGVAEACGAAVGAAVCRPKPVFGFNGATYGAAESTAPCAVQSRAPHAAEERSQWEVA